MVTPSSYLEWRTVLECRYDTLPRWLHREDESRKQWESYVRAQGFRPTENGKVLP